MSKNQNFRRGRVTINVGPEEPEEITAADLIRQQEEKKKQRLQTAAKAASEVHFILIFQSSDQLSKRPQTFSDGPSKKRMIRSDAPLPFTSEEPTNVYLQSTAGSYSAADLAALRKNGIALTTTAGPVFSESEHDANIPDQVSIQMARERRERARGDPLPPAPDFIQIDKHSGREKNYQDPLDEVPVYDSSRDQISVRAQLRDALERSDSDDDEVKQWELEQIRKGGAKQKPESKSKASTGPQRAQATVTELDLEVLDSTPRFGAKDVDSLLASQLSKLELSLSSHRSELQRLEQDVKVSNDRIAEHEATLRKNKQNRDFLQQIDNYVEQLVESLSESTGPLLEIERKLQQARATRANQFRDCVFTDIDDEATDIQMELLYDPSNPDSTEDSSVAQARAMRRPGRQRRAQSRRIKRDKTKEEGWSSDEEDPLFVHKYENEKTALLGKVSSVLDGQPTECADIAIIKSRFHNWKMQHGDSYAKAFISLSMPSVFDPLVRAELFQWEPLETELEEQNWFKVLFDFGIPESGEIAEGDPDANLIPTLVQKVAIPKLTIFVGQCWYPNSSSQTAKLQQLLDSILDFGIPQESIEMKNLLTAVILALQSAVDRSNLPVYPSLRNVESPTEAFSKKQLWRTMKLFKNVISWHHILSLGRVQRLSLELLLNLKILPFVRKTESLEYAVDILTRILSFVPRSWLSSPLPAGLMILADYAKQIASRAGSASPDVQRQVRKQLELLGESRLADSLQRTWKT